MERAAAATRTPTIHEPAGYEFSPANVAVIDAMPPAAQTELALQLAKVVMDNSRANKPKRVLEPPTPINHALVRQALSKAASTGRSWSRQGSTFMFPVREGSLRDPTAGALGTPYLNRVGDELCVSQKDPGGLPLPTCTGCAVSCDPGVLTMHGGAMLCPVCVEFDARECPGCHGSFLWYHMQTVTGEGEGLYCRTCYEARMTTCPSCDRAVPRGTVRNGCCPGCIADRFIKSHSHKPPTRFHLSATGTAASLPPGAWCMGVELETELSRGVRKGEKALAICDVAPDFLYAKEDGSLVHGVEYVSHPFTWEWLRDHGGRAKWQEILSLARSTGHKSFDTDTTGMHVHVTKAPWLHGPLRTLMKFVYDNPTFILELSRRKEADLMQWASPRQVDPRLFRVLDAGGGPSPSKYSAINVTTNTIEFRIFRGTLAEAGFFANLECMHALLHYAKRSNLLLTTHDASVSGFAMSPRDFRDWVETNAAAYPNLIATLLRSTVKA